jgi:hypothetical protein
MKCYARQEDGGICVQRQGKVLSKADMLNIHYLADKDVCSHRVGEECGFVSKNTRVKKTVRHAQASAYFPGEIPEDRELISIETEETDWGSGN